MNRFQLQSKSGDDVTTQYLFHRCKSREEWLEARKSGLGASDAAVYLGLSPWKTNEALWEEKTGLAEPEDIGDKPVVRYGNDAEPLLRDLFRLDHPEYNVSFTPYKIWHHIDRPCITCTPDGELREIETGRHGGLEIKTTEIRNGQQWEQWRDRIPDHYYAQICQQFSATGWAFIELLAQIKYTTADGQDRKETRHYKFERADCLDDIALVERAAAAFWQCVTERKRPPLKLPAI